MMGLISLLSLWGLAATAIVWAAINHTEIKKLRADCGREYEQIDKTFRMLRSEQT